MLRFVFVIVISIPFIIALYARSLDITLHEERYTEEKRYHIARKICNRIRINGFIKTRIYGVENLPKAGGYVMYPNHQGKYDAVGIIYGHSKPCTLVMDNERAGIPIMKPFLHLIDGRKLDKSDMKSQAKTIQNIVKEVKEGRRYIIFPEGGYDHNHNSVQDFMSGSFKCATRSKAPIVPVALIDSYKPFELNSLKPVTTQVHFLEPLYYDDYKDMTTEEIATLVRGRIVNQIHKYA